MSKPNIVLTTDFSEEAKRAFKPTVALAKRLGATITLVNVVPDLLAIPFGAPFAPPQSSPELPEAVQASREHLAKLRDALGKDVPVTIEVLTDEHAADAIAGYAKKTGAAFIALASHGRKGLRRLVLGSVAEAVLRHAEVPVIVFPPPAG